MATATLPDRHVVTATVHPDTGHTGRAALLRRLQCVLLGAALCAVAAVTLTSEGRGWAWGSPLTELRWYATGLDSRATVLQLVGNLVLLAVPAALLVALRPALERPRRLFAVMLGMSVGIELLQWALPLGRVVSPMDAVLNAVGATAAGLLTAWARRGRRHVQIGACSGACTEP